MAARLDPKFEKVNLRLIQHTDLSEHESQECYEALCAAPREIVDNENSAEMMGNFIFHCHIDFLVQTVVVDAHFWNIFKEFLNDMSPQSFSKCLHRIIKSVLDQQRDFQDAIHSVCKNVLSDNIILSFVAASLASKSFDSQLSVRFFGCISQLQHCLVFIANTCPSEAATYIPLYKLISLECRLFYVMTPYLSQDEIRKEMIEVFLPVRKRLYDYLETVKIDVYSTPLRKRYADAMNSTININRKSKTTFEQANEELKDLSKLNILQALDITAFLENPNLSFKKTFTEQLIFGNKPFPLYKASSHVSLCLNHLFDSFESEINEKPHLAAFILNKNFFMYALMDRLLKSWVETKAETDKDIKSLLELVPIVLEETNRLTSNTSGISYESVVSIALESIRAMDYRVARELQLKGLREGYYKKWAKHLSDFELMLSEQVKDYVLHQRLLQLQRGTWVYAQNPVDPSIKSPTAYFMILSADQSNLAIKEFTNITENLPSLEGNTIFSDGRKVQGNDGAKTVMIPMNSIERFETQEVAVADNTPKDSHLIGVLKNVYTEVKFLDKSSKCLLKAYFDTKEGVCIWLDGLQMISSTRHGRGVSETTRHQIETLVDIRRNVQMINLNIKEAFEAPETSSSDEEYYDVGNLKELTAGFYYE